MREFQDWMEEVKQMERLTLEEAIVHAKETAERNYRGADFESIDYIDDDIKANCVKCAEEHEQLAEWLEELKYYKDLEEQGLLVRLPCKVGDDVYIIPSPPIYGLNIFYGCENVNRVYHQHIESITFAGSHWYATGRNEYKEKVLNDTAFGMTWFLTREEAENKLEEMKK